MATLAPQRTRSVAGGTRFFTIMAFVMSAIIVAGFSVNLAFGRSTFAVPVSYHVHAVVFMGWIALFLAQHVTASSKNWALHRTLGKFAYFWVPAMVVVGTMIMLIVARRTGGPFFFNKSEFLISNIVTLWGFGGIAWWALRRQRYTGWHRRLFLVSMAMLVGPGIGRLLPMPLLIPYAWPISQALTFLFPVIGMIADKRATGSVHPAYKWGLGIYVGLFLASMVLAYSPLGYAMTEAFVAGTPGADRPMDPFLPPGFTM
ncbi:hypothetical protein [Qipengyuania atrilutea]|uniref:Uncharacterized protein n=1 Tax=Qipengyuania atrilutea TaxID=2744473 RepID=A0A850H2Q9_9SPHN|nr:hypothetical protein [Actirhodobacter atriluteus]NVD44966.1 hypothetical protein [Actirhodobacter atriluteus]